MILVTGATGNVGGSLLGQLHDEDTAPLRGLARDATRASLPAGVEVMEGDLTRAASVEAALASVRSLFLVPVAGDERELLRIAQQAGVEHVTLLSSLSVQTHPHLHSSGRHLAIEQAVKDSRMTWTILRATQFASNTLGWAATIREHGTVFAPYGDTALPTIHPGDIAAVARRTLTDPIHQGQTYPLTGPQRISPRRQVAAIETAAGRDLSFIEISREQAHEQMAPYMGDKEADAILDLMGGDVNDEVLTVHDTVARVTGSPAAPFQQWASENAAAFR